MKAGKRRIVAALVVGVAVVGAGVQHAWTCIAQMADGVHFNTEVPDFGAPPQSVVIPYIKFAPARSGSYNSSWGDWRAEEAEEDRIRELSKSLPKAARQADAHRHYRRAIGLYRRLIAEGIGEDNYWRDRIEVFEQVLRKGAPARLDDYLRARNRLERGNLWLDYFKRIKAVMRSIARDPKAGFLRAHALYTIASIDWKREPDVLVAKRFGECARLYPKGPRAEPALIMAARTILWDRGGPKRPKSELAQGRAYAAELLAKYPHSRFKPDAIGWIGRVEFVMGRYDSALRIYRRQLAAGGSPFGVYDSMAMCYDAKGLRDRSLACYLRMYASQEDGEGKEKAVSYVLGGISALRKQDLARFCRSLKEGIGLLQPYLECRLYYTRGKPAELTNLVRLSEAALRRHPGAQLGSAVWARLSEINYLRKRYKAALRFAGKAIGAGSRGAKDLDLAWYVKASSLSKLGHRSEATHLYESLIRRFPGSRLVPAARENLALSYERDGRLGMALAQYLRLKYHEDVAYLLDVRMTPEQVKAFIRTSSPSETRQLATYALGIRYLRKDRFRPALREFAKLSRSERRSFAGLVPAKDDSWWEKERRELMQDPVQTATDLMSLHVRIRSAHGPERKAKAIYDLAAYFYNEGYLHLYNESLWHGYRAMGYGFYWNPTVATTADNLAWRKHSYEHEGYARARALCLEILHRYPHTKVAPKAVYTAAISCYHLSGFNPWWREENVRVHLGDQAARLMKLLVKRYPKSSLRKAAEKYASVYDGEREEMERNAIAEISERERFSPGGRH